MGIRASVIFHQAANAIREASISPVIHLQWWGEPEYIYAFMDELVRRGVHYIDAEACAARFVEAAGSYMAKIGGAPAYSLRIGNGPKSITRRALLPHIADDYGLYLAHLDPTSPDGFVIERHLEDGRMEGAQVRGEAEKAREDGMYNSVSEFLADQAPLDRKDRQRDAV